MIEVKKCTSCKESKPLNEFSPDRRRPDGSIYFKPVCKACNNKKWKAGKRQDYGKTKKERGSDNNVLSAGEVAGLQELLKVKGELLSLLDHKTSHNNTITTGKADRIKKTYNVDPELVEEMNRHSIETGVNQSDIVNAALKAYLNRP